jgi:hypothetical protein
MGEAQANKQDGTQDTGFEGYRSQMRHHSFGKMPDLEIGKAWMRGEAQKAAGFDYILLHPLGEEPKQRGDEISLMLVYKGKVFKALVRPDFKLIDEMVSIWGELCSRSWPHKRDRWRDKTRDALLDVLLSNMELEAIKHQDGEVTPWGVVMAYGIAWMVFTSSVSDMLKEGVKNQMFDTFGYDITEAPTSTPEHRINNWRQFSTHGPLDLASVRSVSTPAWEPGGDRTPKSFFKIG